MEKLKVSVLSGNPQRLSLFRENNVFGDIAEVQEQIPLGPIDMLANNRINPINERPLKQVQREQSCAAGHSAMITKAIEEGYEFLLAFEDDTYDNPQAPISKAQVYFLTNEMKRRNSATCILSTATSDLYYPFSLFQKGIRPRLSSPYPFDGAIYASARDGIFSTGAILINLKHPLTANYLKTLESGMPSDIAHILAVQQNGGAIVRIEKAFIEWEDNRSSIITAMSSPERSLQDEHDLRVASGKRSLSTIGFSHDEMHTSHTIVFVGMDWKQRMAGLRGRFYHDGPILTAQTMTEAAAILRKEGLGIIQCVEANGLTRMMTFSDACKLLGY